MAREVAGEKQRQQDSDRFDGLQRPEIHLRGTAGRSVPENNQRDREQQRSGQRQVAEVPQERRAHVHGGDHEDEDEPDENPLGVSHEQGRVAKRIRAAHHDGEADRRQRVDDGQKHVIAGHTAPPPEQRDGVKPGDVERRPRPAAPCAPSRECGRRGSGLIAARSAPVIKAIVSGARPCGGRRARPLIGQTLTVRECVAGAIDRRRPRTRTRDTAPTLASGRTAPSAVLRKPNSSRAASRLSPGCSNTVLKTGSSARVVGNPGQVDRDCRQLAARLRSVPGMRRRSGQSPAATRRRG